MLDALLKGLHVLAAIVWVGGMAFAHTCLRPSLAVLPAPQRPALMHAVLRRFFAIVVVAAPTAWVTGAAMLARGGVAVRPGLMVMAALGTAMVLVFLWIRLVPFVRFDAAMRATATGAQGPPPPPAEALQALARIRHAVAANLALGFIVVAAALVP